MNDYWEDRLSRAQHQNVSKALVKFRRGYKNWKDQCVLRDILISLGVHDEEAEEIINLEMQEE